LNPTPTQNNIQSTAIVDKTAEPMTLVIYSCNRRYTVARSHLQFIPATVWAKFV